MQKQPLVSIIIPTYNRAHLIGETLDSIIAQTYINWECIVVDDGSTDDTTEILKSYCQKDSRIQYHHRPEVHLPGGNGARNYGFKLSKGEFIQWFDSDDLMVDEKIELKVKAMLEHNVDFIISKTKYFNSSKNLEKNYKFHRVKVSFVNFLYQRINWLTPDFFVKRIAVNKICFNEEIKSGQEFNFLLKFLITPKTYYFLNKILTLRRDHPNSIQKKYRTPELRYTTIFNTHKLTFQEISSQLNFSQQNFYLHRMLFLGTRKKKVFFLNFFFFLFISYRLKSLTGVLNLCGISLSYLIFNKTYYFLNKFKN